MNLLRIRNSLVTKFYSLILKPFFKSCGKNIRINNPLKIDGFKNIIIGNDVRIEYKTWLAASNIINKDCVLEIKEGSVLGSFNHIYATKEIIIGKNVLTADKVYISDNLHRFENIEIPILKQGIKQIQTVKIGDGTWIGENVCIIGVKIGKNCIIAANAVVTKDIPDYCVVGGVPAIIMKRYNKKTREWLKTNKNGEFI